MRRKTFDVLVSAGGAIMVAVLLVAGSMLWWGYSFANSNVTSQLAQQNITFPAASAFAHPVAGSEITPSMIGTVSLYAGQPLTTGQQAEVYANDFIAVHLQEIGQGQTYAQWSALAMAAPAGSAMAIKDQAIADTLFKGTTLRGLLLEGYGFSVFATIAQDGAIAAFALASLMALLVGFGYLHARRTSDAKEILVRTSMARGPLATA
jgi:hypothetical protein